MKMLRRPNPQWLIGLSFVFLTVFWIGLRLPTAAQALMDTDGGHQLAGAMQILHGEQPFVDYEATYGPFTFYASALAQIVFGQLFIGEMILRTLGYTITYVFLALLIYQMTGKPALAFLLGILAMFAMPQLYKYYLVAGPVLTIWFVSRYIEHPKTSNIFWLALTAMITGLFRSDFGVYCTIAATAAVVLQPSSRAGAFKRAFILWGETFLLALPFLLFLAFKGGLDNYFSDMLIGGPNIATGMALPFPTFQFNQPTFSLDNLFFMAMIFFFSLPCISLLFLVVRWKNVDEKQRKVLLSVILLYAFSLIQASTRTGYVRLEQTIVLAFLLAAWMINRVWDNIRSPAFTKTSAVYLFILLLLCAGVSTPIFLLGRSAAPQINLRGIPEKLRQYALPKDKMLANANKGGNLWYAETMQYIRRCTTAQQKLMALPILTTFYYFTDRSFGGGQIGIVSGYFVTPKDQQRILAKMKEEDIPLVVYWPDFVFDNIPERKLEAVAPAVASYIQANYQVIKKVGPVDLMLRSDLKVEKRAAALRDFSCPVAQP